MKKGTHLNRSRVESYFYYATLELPNESIADPLSTKKYLYTILCRVDDLDDYSLRISTKSLYKHI